jgi:hypothetical protein
VLPSPTRIEYASPKATRQAVPIALLPATMAAEMMSLWMTSGLTLATQALRFGAPAASPPSASRALTGSEPDPVRP